jgi:hypothetical protein
MNLDKQVANMGKFLFLSVIRKQLYGIVQQGLGFLSQTSPSQARTFLQQACDQFDETDEPPRFHKVFFLRSTL